MATLPTRSRTAIVATIAAGMQSRSSIFLTFIKGSVLLVIADAYSGMSLFLQSMALQIVKLTRLATSFGQDVDSWLADYGLIARIGSTPSTGLVVFSRYTASAATPLIKVGSTVRTSDGKTSFAVYADTTNPAYDPVQNGYVLPAQVQSLVVPVVCITPSPNGTVQADGTIGSGANGNILAGAINTLTSQISGVDTVTNPAPFTNGSDQESDPAVKARFRLAINSLSKGTEDAIKLAVQSLQTNLQVVIRNCENLDGSENDGMITVIVDDGSGNLPNTVLAAAAVAANAVRAAGTRMGVFAAVQQLVAVQLTLTVQAGYQRQNVAALVSAAIASGINSLGVGNGLNYFTVASWAMSVPGVAKIDGLLVNNSNLDIPGDPRYTLKCSGVVVN